LNISDKVNIALRAPMGASKNKFNGACVNVYVTLRRCDKAAIRCVNQASISVS
jgi:hypothetical protein